MKKVVLNEARCKGCELCITFCPKKVLKLADHMNAKGYHPAMLADEENCISCGTCARMCPDAVIEVFKEN